MFSGPLPFKSVPQPFPPPAPPHSPLQIGRPLSPSWAAAHLRSVLLLPMPTGVGSRSPVPPSPQPGHLCTTLPPPRHICIPTLAPQPHPRTQTRPCPPPSPTRSGSHLRGSAAAAQKAALLQLGSGCCSRLLLLLLLPSSPRCPRRTRGSVTGDARVVSGCHPQLSPPTPRPLAPSSLGLNSRSSQGPPPLAPRDGHALSGGCCVGAAGLLKEPAAAIRCAPGSSLAGLGPSTPGWRCPTAVPPPGLMLIPLAPPMTSLTNFRLNPETAAPQIGPPPPPRSSFVPPSYPSCLLSFP